MAGDGTVGRVSDWLRKKGFVGLAINGQGKERLRQHAMQKFYCFNLLQCTHVVTFILSPDVTNFC